MSRASLQQLKKIKNFVLNSRDADSIDDIYFTFVSNLKNNQNIDIICEGYTKIFRELFLEVFEKDVQGLPKGSPLVSNDHLSRILLLITKFTDHEIKLYKYMMQNELLVSRLLYIAFLWKNKSFVVEGNKKNISHKIYDQMIYILQGN
jgi:hypothetical protein